MHSDRVDRLLRLVSLACGVALLWADIGCASASETGNAASSAPNAPAASQPGAGQSLSGVHGRVEAGPLLIAGAHIYLYAANTTGYGAASLWLITPGASGVAVDDLGPYLLTDAQGSFDFTGRYGCIPGQLVYAVARGGSPGSADAPPNPALRMMTVLGTCPAEGNFGQTQPFININQVSTVVTAYALQGFMADVAHVSASDSDNARAGLRNAFAAVGNLVNVSSGTAYLETPDSSGVVPAAEINSLANAILPCTNAFSACGALFALTPDRAGQPPADTVAALLNIARNPAANTLALYTLGVEGAFQPALRAAPPDWTLAVTYYAPNMAGPYFPAVDAQGNLWVPGFANNTLTEFSPTGELLSGEGGFSGGGLSQPFAIAVDMAGDAWVSNFGGTTPAMPSLSQFGANGAALASTGFGCGAKCTFIAVDAAKDLWVSGSPQVTAVKASGIALSAFNTNGFTAGVAVDSQGRGWTIGSGRTLDRLTLPATVAEFAESVTAASGTDLTPLAIDADDHLWFASAHNSALGKHANDGSALSPAGGFTGGGLHAPAGIAIDGAGVVWVANRDGNSLSAFANDGSALSPAAGYQAAGVSNPRGIAIDPSGNVWVTNFTGNSVTEFLGAATPTATPLLPGNHGRRP